MSTRATQRTLAPRCSNQTVIIHADSYHEALNSAAAAVVTHQQMSLRIESVNFSAEDDQGYRPEARYVARSLNVDERRGRMVTVIALGLKESHYRIPTTRELRSA
jgi:hypothetical protein